MPERIFGASFTAGASAEYSLHPSVALPATLAGGAVLTTTVTYCPTNLGTDNTQVAVTISGVPGTVAPDANGVVDRLVPEGLHEIARGGRMQEHAHAVGERRVPAPHAQDAPDVAPDPRRLASEFPPVHADVKDAVSHSAACAARRPA